MSAEWNSHSPLDCGEYIGGQVTEMIAGRDKLIQELRDEIDDLRRTVESYRAQEVDTEPPGPRLRRVLEPAGDRD